MKNWEWPGDEAREFSHYNYTVYITRVGAVGTTGTYTTARWLITFL